MDFRELLLERLYWELKYTREPSRGFRLSTSFLCTYYDMFVPDDETFEVALAETKMKIVDDIAYWMIDTFEKYPCQMVTKVKGEFTLDTKTITVV